jgi:hypothetical protein
MTTTKKAIKIKTIGMHNVVSHSWFFRADSKLKNINEDEHILMTRLQKEL